MIRTEAFDFQALCLSLYKFASEGQGSERKWWTGRIVDQLRLDFSLYRYVVNSLKLWNAKAKALAVTHRQSRSAMRRLLATTGAGYVLVTGNGHSPYHDWSFDPPRPGRRLLCLAQPVLSQDSHSGSSGGFSKFPKKPVSRSFLRSAGPSQGIRTADIFSRLHTCLHAYDAERRLSQFKAVSLRSTPPLKSTCRQLGNSSTTEVPEPVVGY